MNSQIEYEKFLKLHNTYTPIRDALQSKLEEIVKIIYKVRNDSISRLSFKCEYNEYSDKFIKISTEYYCSGSSYSESEKIPVEYLNMSLSDIEEKEIIKEEERIKKAIENDKKRKIKEQLDREANERALFLKLKEKYE